MGSGPRGFGGAALRRLVATALLAAAPPALVAPPAGAEDAEGPDAAVFRRIEALRAPAMGIRIDGRARDWRGIPFLEDRDAANVLNSSLDIVRMAVVPREDDLLVLVETRDTPSPVPFSFQLEVDFLGLSGRDATVQVGASGPGLLAWVHPEGGKTAEVLVQGMEVGVSDAVEVRIPLAPLATALGGAEGKAWLEGARRPCVRVHASTLKGIPPVVADDGPSAASFRIVPTPYALDPPLRPDGAPRRAVRLPLEGKWLVRQGAHGLWSHKGIWAYDLSVVDHALLPTAVKGSTRLEDYYSFGKPVVAPEAGKVVLESAPAEDRPPLEKGAGKDSGNTLVVRFEDGFRLSFGHLKKDSVAFRRGEAFAAGEVLGRVGNSGDSGAPHLHLFLSDRPGDYEGMPLALREVRVGLNPGPDDPWERDLPTWAIREGWFVRPR